MSCQDIAFLIYQDFIRYIYVSGRQLYKFRLCIFYAEQSLAETWCNRLRLDGRFIVHRLAIRLKSVKLERQLSLSLNQCAIASCYDFE